MLVVIEENGFPVELQSEREIVRAIDSGRLRPATIVRAGADHEGLSVSRAEEVAFLRPLLGLFDDVPVEPASAAVSTVPSYAQAPVSKEPPLWSTPVSFPQQVVESAANPIAAPNARQYPPVRSFPPAITPYRQPSSGLGCAFMPIVRYAQFDGRSSRVEFWGFQLLQFVGLFLLLGAGSGPGAVLMGLALLGLILPNIAVSVRRLHDHNQSGWFVLFGIIPYIGWLVVAILMLMPSDKGVNRFGPNPASLL